MNINPMQNLNIVTHMDIIQDFTRFAGGIKRWGQPHSQSHSEVTFKMCHHPCYGNIKFKCKKGIS